MNEMFRYTRSTLIIGVIFSILFIPAVQGLSLIFPYPLPFRATVCFFIAVYGGLINAWGGKKLHRILFPLLLLFIFQFTGVSRFGFLMLTLLILGWIRTGSGFSGGMVKKTVLELVVSFGGGLLVIGFNPTTPLTWALGIWLFFLVQSLYFLFFIRTEDAVARDDKRDSFDRARKGAEKILAGL